MWGHQKSAGESKNSESKHTNRTALRWAGSYRWRNQKMSVGAKTIA